MKLSMWMIANELMSLEPELEISDEDPPILNSARLVYATNCVHIYAENNYVVCNGEGNRIKIFDMEVKRVFELVQGIFDTYEDWSDALIRHIRQRNYQQAIDEAWKIFKNPLILLDGDNKVLGMTRQYGEDSLDEEWAYLYRYGFSSLNAVSHMRHNPTRYHFANRGFQSFQPKDSNYMQYPGAGYSMFFDDIYCGRINILEKERPLNPGDIQLLEYLADFLEPSLEKLALENLISNPSSVFLSIIHNEPYDRQKLEMQLVYQNWNADDTYQLAMIRLASETDPQVIRTQLASLVRLLSNNIPRAGIFQEQPYVIILANYNLQEHAQSGQFLQKLIESNPLQISFSLPIRGILNAGYLYKQALFALTEAPRLDPGKSFYVFWKFAVDYLLLSNADLEDKKYACMPEVRELWKLQQEKGDVMFQTLECFLNCERSIAQTSQVMFLHKNTLSYRIKKTQDFLKWDLEDPYVRQYCALSIRILNIYEKLDGIHKTDN